MTPRPPPPVPGEPPDPDDIGERLAAAGRRPAPPPDAAFADRLESRLRAGDAAGGAPVPGPAPSGWRRPVLVAAAIAASVLAVVLLTARPDRPGTLTLTAATATDIVLVDGTVVAGTPGLVLPAGAMVRAGDRGSAAAGGVVVPGGRTAVVVDGGLVLVDEPGGPAPTTTTTTPRPVPTTVPTSSPAPTTSGPTTAPPPTAPPTTAAAAPTTALPAPTTTPARPTNTAVPPTTTTATTVPAPTTTAPPVEVRLRATRTADGEVVLRWSPYVRPDFGRYVVLRRHGARTLVVAERFDPAATMAGDRPPDGPVEYRILVLDVDGRVVGSSAVVSP